ncbi:MAG: chemotaxis protein [Novosphingobium sp. 63-713]|uniref:hypothetical protein n=2 Tax=Novosphingobium TaxID=165696 RepID=UPI00095ED2BD|nr:MULTISPECIES: hypothetical protein [unclassified Novosphingobium]MBN9145696.1 hypothetical protein [Novosphingobium sp.]OJX87851.1 MAG: chemotaxis protein [Novosphingobium sp. 63-713]
MKLVFRQYLASLKERKELDAVLPDLLSELGYTVISRPTIGTRQYGVDVAAVGRDADGRRKLFLFSIKQGDLTRADWDGSPQALRSSINDILDVYIPTRVSEANSKLEIVICLCFGGEIQEAVRDNVTQFTRQQTKNGISFAEWNGDYMAGLLVDGVLREQLVDKSLCASFQKAVAMVDEPQVAFEHFERLLRGLCKVKGTNPRQRATILRQIYICLWVQFVWARDAGNVEGPYRASELAILLAWNLIRADIPKSTKASEEVSFAFSELVNLHFLIWDELIGRKILPFVDHEHAISTAVASSSPVDINLKLFTLMGRMAMRGLWHLWFANGGAKLPQARADWDCTEALELAQQIAQLGQNNPILLTPITDEQCVDIGVTLMFLTMMGPWCEAAGNYADAIIKRTAYAFRSQGRYPTIYADYRALLVHPRERTPEYREGQTKGSSLYPLLSLWASTFGEGESARFLADFAEKNLGHCNMQFWLVGSDSEDLLYLGDHSHGASLGSVPITADGDDAMRVLESECARSTAFDNLSVIRFGHWPILAMACRQARLPLPPNLWLDLLRQARAQRDTPAAEPTSGSDALIREPK